MFYGLKSLFLLLLQLFCVSAIAPLMEQIFSFFQYLTTSHETVTPSHPNAEILYLGDLNVHHTEWLGSSHTDTGGKEAKLFSILNDLEELIWEPTHIPDRPNQFLNTLDLCFTTTPSSYKYTIFPPIGNSDHNLIALSYNAFSP